MGVETDISWTDHTWNPWWGCVKVSPACDHCYAETFSKRVGFSETGSQFPIWGKDSQRRFFGDKHWDEPVKWNAALRKSNSIRARWNEPPLRERVFCASMADVMEGREDQHESLIRLFNLIDQTPNLDWLLLTKRPQNFNRLLPLDWREKAQPNVWPMTTVEGSKYLWRIKAMMEVPAVVYGISAEPLLEGFPLPKEFLDLGKRGWVIVGGESGRSARPMQTGWAKNLRDQCVEAGVPFHFKQFGEHDASMARVGKKKAGRLLDGREWNEFPGASNVR